jgi:hypothetical protein
MEVGRREGRPSQHQAPGEPVLVTIVHPQKDVPLGRAVDTVKKIRLEIK